MRALPIRLALRSMRGAGRPSRLFIACIALGVAALVALDLAGLAVRNGLARDGRALLGGDIEVARIHSRATPAEADVLAGLGRVSEVATLRAMARTEDGSRQALIDLKAVDGAYPLFGTLDAGGTTPLAATLADGGAVADQSLLDQLGVAVGQRVLLGERAVTIRAALAGEPDRLSGGPGFGPRLLVALPTLETTALLQPGSLVDWRYRIALAADAPVAAQRRVVARYLETKVPNAGFTVRDSSNPSPQANFALRRLSEILSLVALAALLIGGIGVANGVAAFMARNRTTLAIYKALGARQATILQATLLQLLATTVIGVTLGIAAGIALPYFGLAAASAVVPVPLAFTLDGWVLARAAFYGLAVAAAFGLWALGQAGVVHGAELLRPAARSGRRIWPPLGIVAACAVALIALAAMLVLRAEQPVLTLGVLAVVLIGLAVFAALGAAATALARRLPRPRQPELALALANVGAPDGLTRTIVVSLGLGLTLLTAIAAIDRSVDAELGGRVPERAPSHFFIGVPKADEARFREIVASAAPAAQLATAPMLRGRIVTLNGVPASEANVPEASRWVLSGDRGLTFADAAPADSTITDGAWWQPGTAEPQVSIEVGVARGLGVKVGDRLGVNVLGRVVEARIANLRTVNWESLGINFVMIFSASALQAAPYGILATLEGGAAGDAAMMRSVSQAFPGVTTIRVADAVATVARLVGRIRDAVGAAAGLTLIAGLLVLGGAVATAREQRSRQAVLLKVLGVPRRRILIAGLAEYALLAATACLAAVPLGLAAAALLANGLMEIALVVPASVPLAIMAGALLVMLIIGWAATRRTLASRPAGVLRSG